MSINKEHLQKIVYNGINTRRKITMSSIELQYLQSQIKQLSQQFVDKYPLDKLVPELINTIIAGFKYLPLEPRQIDMHEVLKSQIGTQPETQNTILTPDLTRTSDDATHVLSILGLTTPMKIQRMFNPIALETKAYVQLDRRFQSGKYDNTNTFSWDLSNISAIGSQGVLSTSSRINDIISIKMFPFLFPITPNAYPNNRLTVTINEFVSQSYSSTTHYTNTLGQTSLSTRQFHFEFVLEPKQVGGYNMYLANDIGQSPATFGFYRPIEELRTLTISFANPFIPLTLESDRGVCTITSLANTSLLTFNSVTFLNPNDLIYLLNFTTTNPNNDVAIISLMNSQYGWPVTIISSTEVTIAVDIRDLVGNIVPNTNCYFDSKRFSPRIEFTFRRPLE
jgi:hypothetical protein